MPKSEHETGQPASAPDLLTIARAYVACGWAVIPLRPGSKRPLIAWEAYQHRLPTDAELMRWFDDAADANIGIVTGKRSGLAVLDIDKGHGGEDSLRALQARHKRLPKTPEVRTGGGGRHLYFRYPGVMLRNRTGIAPGLDLRAEGGYVVAPPSLHPSGQRYSWTEVGHIDRAPLAMPPPWLLDLAAGTPDGQGHPLPYWRALVRQGVKEGERNNTIASLTGHLLWRNVDPDVILELLLCWNEVRCQPPLSTEEVARTVESIRRTHGRHQTAPSD